jgi:hypothetical protein
VREGSAIGEAYGIEDPDAMLYNIGMPSSVDASGRDAR